METPPVPPSGSPQEPEIPPEQPASASTPPPETPTSPEPPPAEPAPEPASETPLLPPPPSPVERTWAMAGHLSALAGHFVPFGHIFGPLIIWLIKRDESEFVGDQAKEALNAQISFTIYAAVAAVLILVLIGFALLFVIWLADLILIIVAAVSANEGKYYRYPLILRLIK
jgi:uncharacterized protein